MSSIFIDDQYDVKKEPSYSLIRSYFGNVKFFKLKDENNMSIYICKIYSNTNEKRYLIAIIPRDNFDVGTEKRLGALKWISFQTRVLPENYKIEAQNYTQKRSEIFESELELIKRFKNRTEYRLKNGKYPIKISLLHSKKGLWEFQDTGALNSAIESYCTVITFL